MHFHCNYKQKDVYKNIGIKNGGQLGWNGDIVDDLLFSVFPLLKFLLYYFSNNNKDMKYALYKHIIYTFICVLYYIE